MATTGAPKRAGGAPTQDQPGRVVAKPHAEVQPAAGGALSGTGLVSASQIAGLGRQSSGSTGAAQHSTARQPMPRADMQPAAYVGPRSSSLGAPPKTSPGSMGSSGSGSGAGPGPPSRPGHPVAPRGTTHDGAVTGGSGAGSGVGSGVGGAGSGGGGGGRHVHGRRPGTSSTACGGIVPPALGGGHMSAGGLAGHPATGGHAHQQLQPQLQSAQVQSQQQWSSSRPPSSQYSPLTPRTKSFKDAVATSGDVIRMSTGAVGRGTLTSSHSVSGNGNGNGGGSNAHHHGRGALDQSQQLQHQQQQQQQQQPFDILVTQGDATSTWRGAGQGSDPAEWGSSGSDGPYPRPPPAGMRGALSWGLGPNVFESDGRPGTRGGGPMYDMEGRPTTRGMQRPPSRMQLGLVSMTLGPASAATSAGAGCGGHGGSAEMAGTGHRPATLQPLGALSASFGGSHGSGGGGGGAVLSSTWGSSGSHSATSCSAGGAAGGAGAAGASGSSDRSGPAAMQRRQHPGVPPLSLRNSGGGGAAAGRGHSSAQQQQGPGSLGAGGGSDVHAHGATHGRKLAAIVEVPGSAGSGSTASPMRPASSSKDKDRGGGRGGSHHGHHGAPKRSGSGLGGGGLEDDGDIDSFLSAISDEDNDDDDPSLNDLNKYLSNLDQDEAKGAAGTKRSSRGSSASNSGRGQQRHTGSGGGSGGVAGRGRRSSGSNVQQLDGQPSTSQDQQQRHERAVAVATAMVELIAEAAAKRVALNAYCAEVEAEEEAELAAHRIVLPDTGWESTTRQVALPDGEFAMLLSPVPGALPLRAPLGAASKALASQQAQPRLPPPPANDFAYLAQSNTGAAVTVGAKQRHSLANLAQASPRDKQKGAAVQVPRALGASSTQDFITPAMARYARIN